MGEHKSATRKRRLTDKQMAVADGLFLGEAQGVLAKRLGIGRKTIARWILREEYQEYWNALCDEGNRQHRQKMRSAIAIAGRVTIQTLAGRLEIPHLDARINELKHDIQREKDPDHRRTLQRKVDGLEKQRAEAKKDMVDMAKTVLKIPFLASYAIEPGAGQIEQKLEVENYTFTDSFGYPDGTVHDRPPPIQPAE